MIDLFLDHILVAVHDVDKAGRTYSERLGFTVTPTGIHPDRGTRNRLVVFESEYLELISVDEPHLAARIRPDLVSLLARREGLFMFALGTDHLDETIAAVRHRGVDAHEPRAGSRRDVSDQGGYTWRSAEIDPGVTPGSATFLIQHDQTIAERYREPTNLTQHFNGGLGITQVTLAVRDVDAASARWRRLLYSPAVPVTANSHALGDVRRSAVRLRNCELEFVSPRGPGPVRNILREYGETPVMISLEVADLRRTIRALNSASVGGTTTIEEDDAQSCLLGPDATHGLFLRLVDAGKSQPKVDPGRGKH